MKKELVKLFSATFAASLLLASCGSQNQNENNANTTFQQSTILNKTASDNSEGSNETEYVTSENNSENNIERLNQYSLQKKDSRLSCDKLCWINCKYNNKSFDLLINQEGEIISSVEVTNYHYGHLFVCNEIAGYSDSENVYHIIDALGTEIVSSKSGMFDEVLAVGDGLTLVYKYESDIDGDRHLYGVLDSSGKWKMELTNINLKDKSYEDSNMIYLKNGMFYVGITNYKGCIINSKKGSYFFISQFYFDSDYSSGSIFISPRNYNFFISKEGLDDYKSDFKCEIGKPLPNLKIDQDGNCIEFSDGDPLFADGRTLVYRNNNETTVFRDLKGGSEIEYSDYYVYKIIGRIDDSRFCVLLANKERDQTFITVLNDGKEVFKPIKADIFPFLTKTSIMISGDGKQAEYNFNGELIRDFESNSLFLLMDNVFLSYNSDTKYYSLLDQNGNEITLFQRQGKDLLLS